MPDPFEGASHYELKTLVQGLVEDGLLTEEQINDELFEIRESLGDRLNSVSKPEKQLSREQEHNILAVLRERFESNRMLHEGINWDDVEKSLKAHPEKLWSIQCLEATGGEPDVVGTRKASGGFVYIFMDCSAESPHGRRNLAYNKSGEDFAINTPDGNVVDMAESFGAEIVDEDQYLDLQQRLKIDSHTESWLKTPDEQLNDREAIYGYRKRKQVEIDLAGIDLNEEKRGFRAFVEVPCV